MDYTIVVCGDGIGGDVRCSISYRIPAVRWREYFMYQGKDVLIIYDDLSQSMQWHTGRLSLLIRRPHRDVKHIRAMCSIFIQDLLERAAKLSDDAHRRRIADGTSDH